MKKILFILLMLVCATGFTQGNSGTVKWRAGVTYSANKVVVHNGVLYKSLGGANDVPPSANWEQISEVAVTQGDIEGLGFVTGAHTVDTDTKLTGPEVLAFVAGGGYVTGSHFAPSTLLSDYGFTDNSTNWNTAFGWGDHSLAGYSTGAHTAGTDLSLSGRTSTQWAVESSTGTNITITQATTTLSGLMSGVDKTKLDGLSMQTLSLVGNDLSITGGNTVDLSTLTGATNLAFGSRTGTQGVISSDTGTDATITSATTTLAGFMSATDKTKLDGLSNQTLSLVGDDLSISGGNTVDLSGYAPQSLAGYVQNSGTPVNEQIAVWTGSAVAKGDARLTLTSTKLNIAEDVEVTSGNLYVKQEDSYMGLDAGNTHPRFGLMKKSGYAGMFASSSNSDFIIGETDAVSINPGDVTTVTQQMKISQTTGNVRIGTGTALASDKLSVQGNIKTENSLYADQNAFITGDVTTVGLNPGGGDLTLYNDVTYGNDAQSDKLIIKRNAAEGNSQLSFYMDAFLNAQIVSTQHMYFNPGSGDNVVFGNSTAADLRLGGGSYMSGNPSIRQHGYVTSALQAEYVDATLEADGEYNWIRSTTDVTKFKVSMPLETTDELVVEGAATLKTLKRVENANTAITITAADFGTFIYCTAGTAVTITIPDTLSPVDGQTFSVAQWGAGQVTIVGSGTTTIVSTSATHKTSEQYAVIQLDHIGSNTDDWHAWGGLENN